MTCKENNFALMNNSNQKVNSNYCIYGEAAFPYLFQQIISLWLPATLRAYF